ncbi:MAG TPA: M48 family metalloprotease, partial [Burkholderiales bacterium]|nr:M48 family metalloprotease [Burkholderiales bacterium]
ARHSVQQISAATAAGVGATLLGVFVPVLRNQVGDTAVNYLGNALLSGYGREHELEADKLGAEYLYRTGYDPQAMVKVIGVLKNQELYDAEMAKSEGRQPRSYHGVFASHPDADKRLQEVVGEAGRITPGTGRVNQEEFLRAIDKMPFGYSENQGFIRNFTFYHRELGFALKFPEGWRITNQSDRVFAVNRGDDVLLEMRSAGRAQGAPADVLRKAVGGAREVTSTTINGLPVAMTTTTVRGLPTRAAAIFLCKSAYVVAGQAKTDAAMQPALPLIDATIASFHALTDTERNSVRPLTLRIITAPVGATFAELAKNSPLPKNAVAHLRLLNGLYPNGEPTAGQALKIIE